jgi:hypothetical protein
MLAMNVRLRILDELAEGRSLRSICRESGMPSVSTVMRWASEDLEFQEQYARAREAGSDAMAEDIQDISDDGSLDPNDRRIRIDARKWLLAKRQPKKYGDKQTLEHSGTVGVHTLSDEELEKRIRELGGA